jgi:hypothetical protein
MKNYVKIVFLLIQITLLLYDKKNLVKAFRNNYVACVHKWYKAYEVKLVALYALKYALTDYSLKGMGLHTVLRIQMSLVCRT